MTHLRVFIIFIFFVSFNSYSKKEVIWKINNDHSEIIFEVPYLGVSSVSGRFNSFTGKAHFNDLIDPLAKKVWITIDTNSIFTGNNMRDGHLKSNNFFKIKKYPTISFQSEDITPISPGKYRIKGILKIKDKVKKIIVDYFMSEDVKDTWGKTSRFIKFEMNILRSEFGLDWNKIVTGESFLVGDTVKVKGQFQIQPLASLTASNKHMIPNTIDTELKDKLRTGVITQSQYNEIKAQVKKNIAQPKIHGERTKGSMAINMSNNTNKVDSTDNTCPEKNNKKSLQWMIWFFVLSAFGFFGSIIATIQFKNLFLKSKKYEETNFFGLITDIPVLMAVFLYSCAVWYVGWQN